LAFLLNFGRRRHATLLAKEATECEGVKNASVHFVGRHGRFEYELGWLVARNGGTFSSDLMPAPEWPAVSLLIWHLPTPDQESIERLSRINVPFLLLTNRQWVDQLRPAIPQVPHQVLTYPLEMKTLFTSVCTLLRERFRWTPQGVNLE